MPEEKVSLQKKASNNIQEINESLPVEADLIRLLRKNLLKNEEVLQLVHQIKNHMRWQMTWSFIRLSLIIIPIVLGFIYLPPVVKEFLSNYPFSFSR